MNTTTPHSAMKHLSFVILTPLLALSLLTACVPSPATPAGEGASSSRTAANPSEAARERQLVEAHIRQNIGSLSPKPPVLGGAFTVTDIAFRTGNRAVIQYEDGHIALRGIAVYTVEGSTVNITSFDTTEM
jgi:hypothetical protein